MIKEPRLTLFDLAVCLSDAADLVSPALVNHHKQVAYIASCIGAEIGLDDNRQKELVLAGIVHDIGALSLAERIDTLSFETAAANGHAEVGYSLLKSFEPTARVSEIVRDHHRYWKNIAEERPVLLESQILHLADRIAVLIKGRDNILRQAGTISEKIRSERGKMFNPELCDAFFTVAGKEYFWLDSISPTVYRILRRQSRTNAITLDIPQLGRLATLLSRIIDFRSRFTATHSAGVAATSVILAGYAGFSKREREYMHIAGLVHDLGKLAVPREILEKPGKLDAIEFDIIRSHTYHTFRILDTLEDFDTINTWGAFHHERLNGKGYPFHHSVDDLSLGSRIMGVADVFTAITEDRPYRRGMSTGETMAVLRTMVKADSLDPGIVRLLEVNIEDVTAARQSAQMESGITYAALIKQD